LLEIPLKKNVHYVEVLNDVPVKTEVKDNTVTLTAPVEKDKVIAIAELPSILKVSVSGNNLLLSLPESYSRETNLSAQVAGAEDLPGQRQEYKLQNGQATIPFSPDKTRTIIKVMKGYYLLDEVILPAN